MGAYDDSEQNGGGGITIRDAVNFIGSLNNGEGGITPKDALNFVGNLVNSAIEFKRIDCDMEKYRMNRDIAIFEITKRYEFAEAFMKKSFKERRKAIEKYFKVIDKGLEQHDLQLVILGVHSITAIVKDSPFKNFDLAAIQSGNASIV